MKKQIAIIFILIFSIINSSYACSCSSLETTSNRYQQSDFVGIVKIIKTYKNEVDSIDTYKVDVETITLLKGKSIIKLQTEGFNGIANRYSSCGVWFEEGKSYLIYANNTSTGTFVGYCGVDRYFNANTLSTLNKIKKHVSHFKVDTRWGRTTYIPYQLYLKYQPDSSKHLSLIKIEVNRKNGTVKISHLSDDDRNFKERIKNVLTEKLNWKTKLDEQQYPNNSYIFILETHPYTNSKYLMEELKNTKIN